MESVCLLCRGSLRVLRTLRSRVSPSEGRDSGHLIKTPRIGSCAFRSEHFAA
jgi:hypothetical protein